MKKRKILIVVLFQNLLDEAPYYALSPASPLPGILLAALTADVVDVEVLHEAVRPRNYNTDADFVGINFMDCLICFIKLACLSYFLLSQSQSM